MGTETMKGSNYAWAIAVACVAFYAIPLGVVANQAGLFASPVMEEFGCTCPSSRRWRPSARRSPASSSPGSTLAG